VTAAKFSFDDFKSAIGLIGPEMVQTYRARHEVSELEPGGV
jgi:hypothetical protein